MTKTKSFSHIIACMLAVVMVLSCLCVPAFAAPHPEDGMLPTKEVTPVGTKSFYKIDIEDGIVVYADTDDGTGWTAVPSAYIEGSSYNEGNISYGAYIVDNDEVVFVPLSECHETESGDYEYYHGTKDSATVSEDVDTATNEDPTMGTDFYLHVENGIDPDGPSKEDQVIGTSDDARVSYEFTIRTKSSYQLNATVPMYVCMYGYRGTGTVVTPTSDAYKLKNYSTVNMDSNASVVDIVKLTSYSQIIDTEHSDENLVAIAYNAAQGKYMWWYSMPSEEEFAKYEGEGWVINKDLADENLNASGECYVIYIDDTWDFKAAGVLDGVVLRQSVSEVDPNHPLSEDLIFNEWNFGKTPAVGDNSEGGENEGLAIKVTELQAVPATWRIVPVSTGISDIRRGELAMSIAPTKAIEDASAIDLAKCSAPIDITERGWFMDAPEIGADGETVDVPTELPLITSARMAGGNVNPAGCTSVVRVIYTVTPMFSIDDGQTGTVGADAVTSNRVAA